MANWFKYPLNKNSVVRRREWENKTDPEPRDEHTTINPPSRFRTLLLCSSWQEGVHWCLLTNGQSGRIINYCFPTLWVYEFMGPLVAPASPFHRGVRSGMITVLDWLTYSNPLTQGELICLCEASHWFRDKSLTWVTSDSEAFQALSMSVKMTSGSTKEPL